MARREAAIRLIHPPDKPAGVYERINRHALQADSSAAASAASGIDRADYRAEGSA
jgi:hypothetical protein